MLQKVFASILPILIVTTLTLNNLVAQVTQQDLHDRDVHAAIESVLRSDELVPSHLFDVQVDDGIVTLVGDVDTLLSHQRAIVLAESIRGVRSIVDRLSVVTPVRADRELERDVQLTLQVESAVEFVQLETNVEKGHVTLDGRVDSYAERDLAEQAVAGIRGVVRLNNRIEVAPKRVRPAREIEEDVEGRLSSDPWLADYSIAVNVQDSSVALSGIVGSLAELRIARRLAWVSGVRDVNTSALQVKRWIKKPMRRQQRMAMHSDQAITKAIQDAYLNDPRLKSSDITTRVKDGTVSLFGRVATVNASRAAERDAHYTLGVNRVHNHLKIDRNEWPGDVVIQKSVQDALKRDAHVGMLNIEATSRSGKLFLNGAVDTQFEKERAELVAANICGVLAVENRLSVDYTWASKSDYEIKEDVERQFFWSPFVDGDFVHVEVDDGIVTLTGSVSSSQESGAATDNAKQGGARRVVNRLKVLNDETARR